MAIGKTRKQNLSSFRPMNSALAQRWRLGFFVFL